ncbi:hypothetical protein [Enterobacter phage vB-EclM_KMB17]|nr:hypothetical protein [Enterobacter phage vB-EclM_KMB17]ULA52552.1 hypothetical protein [Enterobacter phage vB-EclM_KMB20]
MKRILAAVAVSFALTGCVAPQGEIVRADTVGQVKYVGGTGLTYSRSTPQVNQSSIRAGEEYLAQQRANDPIARDQSRVMQKQRELDATYEQRKAAQKCQFIVEAHGVKLYQVMYNNPTIKNINAFEDFRDRGQYDAFKRCMKVNYKEAK